MRNESLFSLIISLLKIYFSKTSNKSILYKRCIFDHFKSMGGSYIKFLQVLCVNYKFMEGWGTPKDYEVFDQVPLEYIDVKKYIKYKEDFSYIEEVPFASGSFAQVYKAKLKAGEEVVIKMLRPSVYNNLEKDLKKINKILGFMSYFLPDSVVNYQDAFEEFARNTILETDYSREVANMEYFYKYYLDNEDVIIPAVYKKYCSEYIIVQEYIEGIPLARLIANTSSKGNIYEKNLQITGSDLWKQISIVGGEALRTAMTSDYVYGDPHMGNIILLPDNKVAFVDFGLIASKPVSQEAYYLWVKAYYDILNGKGDYSKLLESTCVCFFTDITNALRKYFGHNNLINSLSQIFDFEIKEAEQSKTAASSYINNGHLMTMILEYVGGVKAINLKLDLRNFQILKAMQAFLGTVNVIDREMNTENYAEVMKSSMEYAFSHLKPNSISNDLGIDTKYSENESCEILLDLLTSIANKDKVLFYELAERMSL